MAHLTDLARDAGTREPEHLAGSLALLTDGAYEAGRILGPDGPTSQYADAAHSLLDRALPADR